MPSQFEQSGIELVLDTKQYNANVASVIRDAGRVDASLDDVIDAANRAERALNSVDGDVNVDVVVDDQEVRSTQGLIDNLTQTEDVGVTVDDSHIDSAQRDIDNLTQTEDVDVNADTSDIKSALDTVKADLDTLKKLAVIDVVLNVANFAKDIPELPLVSSIIEADNAIQRLEGTTGQVIPEAARIINDVYTGAWGDSKEAIGEVITEAANLGISVGKIGDAVTTAFQVSDTGIGDTTEVLRTMDSMVKNNLAVDFKQAGDLLVTGLQNGADRGKDLLDTFNEYGSTFKELKISGPGAIALITSGLDAGVDNSDRIADAMRETGIRLREIGTDKNIAAAFQQLDELSSVDLQGLLNAYNAGEISGDEFFTGFFDSLKQAVETDPAQASVITATLVGTISEDFGPETIAQLSPEWDETMGVLEGRAETASNTINDTLTSALTGLARTIETELATTLDEKLDVQGLVDKVKAAVPQIAQAIREGTSISQAIEEGLGLAGQPLQKLESVFNNIAIAIMQAVQSILSALGKTKEADFLQSEIARIGEGQFAFDVHLADNGEALRDQIQTAIDRGVDPERITSVLQDRVEDMLARGDLLGANTLIDQIKEQTSVPIVVKGIEFGPDVTPQDILNRLGFPNGNLEIEAEIADAFAARNVNTASLEENARILGQKYQDEFNAAVAAGDYEAALPLAKQLELPPEIVAGIDEMIKIQDNLQTETEETATKNEESASRTSAALDDAEQGVRDYVSSSAQQLDMNAEKFIDWEAKVTVPIDNISGKIDALAGKVGSLNASLGDLGETPIPAGTGGAPPDERARGGGVRRGQTVSTGEEGMELFTAPQAGSIINAANTSALIHALSQIGMGGGSTTNNYITLNSSAHVQSVAQADAFGYRTSRQIRGFA